MATCRVAQLRIALCLVDFCIAATVGALAASHTMVRVRLGRFDIH